MIEARARRMQTVMRLAGYFSSTEWLNVWLWMFLHADDETSTTTVFALYVPTLVGLRHALMCNRATDGRP
jgi:hypothetical protein